MNTFLFIFLTIVIISSFLVMLYFNGLRKLNYYNIRVNKAQNEINNIIKDRYKLIKQSEKIIKKNTKMDLKNFKELDNLKESSSTSSIELESKITENINTIYMVENDYPKIAKKKDFKEVLRNLNESDTNIIAAKSFYNENNKELIELLKKMPTNIIGKLNKIEIKPYYSIINKIEKTITD